MSLATTKSLLPSTSSFRFNYEISMNTLIVWVFCLENEESLTPFQVKKIKNLYGRSKQFLNPIIDIQYLSQILRKVSQLQLVHDRNYVTKLCISLSYLKRSMVIQAIRESNLVQLCVVCEEPWQHSQLTRITNLLSNHKYVIFSLNLNQVVKIATKQVQNFTKSSRTFHNSIPLVKQTAGTVNLYRFRLISCIKIRASDEEARAKNFEAFALQKFDQITMIKSAQTQGLGILNCSRQMMFVNIFSSYKILIGEFHQSRNKLNKIEDKSQREVQYQFWKKIIDIYQQQGFFYQIINNYLRIFKEPKSQWQPLAQPISYIYQSIKGLYSHHKKQDQFYSQPFTVFRGGRIKANQIEQLMQTSIKIKNSSSLKIEDIVTLLRNFQKNQTQFNAKCEQLYVQFFGFLSTTLSQQKAIKTFLNNKNQCDQQTDQATDYGCIFKIDVFNILDSKRPESMRHGYYKFTNQQIMGNSQRQVLFNVLNVFKLKSIKKMRVNKDGKLVEYDDPQCQAVFYIELEYGPFEEMVFDRPIDGLSDYQRNIRLNYCTIYRKMMTSEGFDIADAYQATNELQKSQKYYESKLLIKDSVINSSTDDEKRFSLCKKDNKNYMLSLSRIYEKRGKTEKAIQASKLVIKCYQFLEREGESKIYLDHMQKIEQMENKIVDIVQKSSSVFERKQFLRLKRLQISRQYSKDPMKQLKLTEVDLAEGVLEFQKGELQVSLQCFRKAERSTAGFFKRLREIKNSFFVKQYLINLIFCCVQQPLDKWFFRYSKFVNELKVLKLKQVGGQDQSVFQKILFSSISLYCKTVESIDERIKSLKSPEEFKSILSRFSHQISLLDIDLYQPEESIQPEIVFVQREITGEIKSKMKIIKNKIMALKKDRAQLTLQEITKRKRDIIALIDKYKTQKGLFIIDQKDQSEQKIFQQFIQYFYKQERQKKLAMIREKMRKAEMAKKVINQELTDLTKQIQQFIAKLKEDNYSQSNIEIIQSRNQWAKIAIQKSDYTLAGQQIAMILLNSDNQVEVKYQQLAKAHKMNGQLLIQMQNYDQAIKQLTKSIEFEIIHSNNSRILNNNRQVTQRNDELFNITMGNICENFLNETSKNRQEEQAQNGLDLKLFSFNNNFLEAQLLRCKACLYQACELKKTCLRATRQYQKKKNAQENQKQLRRIRAQMKEIKQEREELMTLVKEVIEQLQGVFMLRERKFKVGDLEVLFPEILGLYELNLNTSIPAAFKHFKTSLQRRDNLYSENSYQSLVMCCEIIYNYSQNKKVYSLILKHRFMERIQKYMLSNEDRQNYGWKLYKARYFMEKYGENDVCKKKQYLEAALSNLNQMTQNMLLGQIQQLQSELERCLNPELAQAFEVNDDSHLYSVLQKYLQHSQETKLQSGVYFLQKRDDQTDRDTQAMKHKESRDFSVSSSIFPQSIFKRKTRKNWLKNNKRILLPRGINGYRSAITSLKSRSTNQQVSYPQSEVVVIKKKSYHLTPINQNN